MNESATNVSHRHVFLPQTFPTTINSLRKSQPSHNESHAIRPFARTVGNTPTTPDDHRHGGISISATFSSIGQDGKDGVVGTGHGRASKQCDEYQAKARARRWQGTNSAENFAELSNEGNPRYRGYKGRTPVLDDWPGGRRTRESDPHPGFERGSEESELSWFPKGTLVVRSPMIR
jgi:hypothetical protein